jgi:D-proline reductase (dithiol) PrdB
MPEVMRREFVDYIQRTREQYDHLGYPPYTWVENDDVPPFAPLSKPLPASRVGLIASGGAYRKGQVAFHFKDDFSYREIPSDTPPEALRFSHFAYDMTDARADPNVVFPLGTLRDLVRSGRIGGLGPNAYSVMGGIYSARRVRDILAPAIANRLVEDEVDLVLLVPV